MEQIRKFLQGKGFALVLAACLLAAAAAGVWAVQTVRGELQKILDGLRDPASSARTAPGIDEGALRWGWWLFWGVIWFCWGARALRAANRIRTCQQLSGTCLHAASLGAYLKRVQRG